MHREGGGVVVDADADPSLIGGQIVNSIRYGAAEFLDQEVVHAHFFRFALLSPFATGVLEIADQFLLLRIDGNDRLIFAIAVLTAWLMTPNCASRSGLSAPSRVLLLACRLNFCFFSNSPTTVWLILCPSLRSSPAKRRRLLHVQRSGDIGSPRASGSTSRSDRRATEDPFRSAICVLPLGGERDPTAAVPARRALSAHARSYSPRSASPAKPQRCRHVPRLELPLRRKAAAAVHPIQAITPRCAPGVFRDNRRRSSPNATTLSCSSGIPNQDFALSFNSAIC